jgi:hypothetical protein
MRAGKTENTNTRVDLPPKRRDEDALWVYGLEDDNGNTVIASVWVPTHEERERIAAGENIRLLIWGRRIAPVAMDLTDEKLTEWPHNND